MKMEASKWKKITKVADLMQQLFAMPEESMRVCCMENGVQISGTSEGCDITLSITRKEQNNEG